MLATVATMTLVTHSSKLCGGCVTCTHTHPIAHRMYAVNTTTRTVSWRSMPALRPARRRAVQLRASVNARWTTAATVTCKSHVT